MCPDGELKFYDMLNPVAYWTSGTVQNKNPGDWISKGPFSLQLFTDDLFKDECRCNLRLTDGSVYGSPYWQGNTQVAGKPPFNLAVYVSFKHTPLPL